jgi:phage terminase small subunit
MKELQYTPLTPADDGNGYIDADGKRWQPLNPKQKKFAREYLKGQNATEAAVKAGYTKNRAAAKRQGSVLLNHNPLLRNYLIDQEIKEAERDRVSMEGHLSALHDLREEARESGQINAAITAEIHRGKVGGLYIDRREVLTAKIDSLSKDQLIDRLGQLITKRVPQTIEGEITNRLGSTDGSTDRSTVLIKRGSD